MLRARKVARCIITAQFSSLTTRNKKTVLQSKKREMLPFLSSFYSGHIRVFLGFSLFTNKAYQADLSVAIRYKFVIISCGCGYTITLIGPHICDPACFNI